MKKFNFKSWFAFAPLGLILILASAAESRANDTTTDPTNGLTLGTQVIVVSGSIVAGATSVDALIDYTPNALLNPNPEVCDFPEDATNPNGHDRFVDIKATITGNSYTISMPISAKRADCNFIPSEIDYSVNGATASETLTIDSTAQIASDDATLKSDGVDPEDTTPFGNMTISCEFSAKEGGLCYSKGDLLPDLFSLDIKPQTFQINIANSVPEQF